MLFLMHPSSLFSLLLIFIFSLFIFKWLFKTPITTLLPPSPAKLPVIGNLHQLGHTPHRSLQALSRKHGPLMMIHLGSTPVLVVSSAATAREIMKTHDLIFSDRPGSRIADRLLYGSQDVAFAPYGEYWRQLKSICVVHLLSNRRVQSYRSIREEETLIMIQKVRKLSSCSMTVNLSKILVSVTNDIICRVVLGRKYGGQFMELLNDFVELLGTFDVGDYIPWLGWLNRINGLDAKLERVGKTFDEFLEGVVAEHMGKRGERGVEDEDFVDILLDIEKKGRMDGFSIDRDAVKAIILDMFAAGTDTTYTVMEWAMTELLRHPKAMNKLQTELRQIAKSQTELNEDDLEKSPYLKAVIKETLRLHSPVPLLVPRRSTQDVKLMGYKIVAGTRVIINAWAIGRDPFSWEEPEEFWPERFLDSPVDFWGHHFELIPFGAGRRGCPGGQFAASVNELALGNLVYKFDFALPGGAKVEDLDISEGRGISVHKKKPLVVVPTCFI